jgi:ectoine hydroxylase-related dioxygenase (phytanoyl-CoA dioxygenase family)
VLGELERLWVAEGENAGRENYVEEKVRRLANLANKGDIFRTIFAHPLVIAAAEAVMGPEVRLSMLNARDIPARTTDAVQPFHSDTDYSGTPDQQGFYSCTAIWMLDDFTPENGATRLIPGTHHSHQVPKDALADPYAPHPDEIVMTGKRGDVAIFNGHCWHGGGANHTDAPRRAILAHYLRSDIPRTAIRRQHISPEVKVRMTPRELEILGVDEKQVIPLLKYKASNFLRSLKTKLPVG